MKINLKEKYKNARHIDFLYDIKNYNGLKTSIVVPYFTILSPIFVIWICYFVWWLFGFNNAFIGYLNTVALSSMPFFIFFFVIVDIRRIVILLMDKKGDIHPIRWLKDSITKRTELWFLLLMFIWIIVATLANPNPSKELRLMGEHDRMQEGVIFYLGYVLIFVFSYLLQSRDSHNRLLIAFLISSIFGCVSTIIDPSGGFLLASNNNTGWAFGFVNSNHYGYFLTLAVLCSACMFITAKTKGMKYFTAITYTLNTVVLFFNDTLGCLIAVLVALATIPIIYSIRGRQFKWLYMIPLGTFVVLSFALTPLAKYMPATTYSSLFNQLAGLIKDFFSVTSAPLSEEATHAGTDRWGLWMKAFKGIKDNPWFGTGDVFFKPHNEYLQHAYNFGILCLAFYLIALVIILVKALKNLRFLSDITLVFLFSILAYLISALFGNTMPHTMPFFMVFLAFSIRSLNIDIEQRKAQNTSLSKNATNIKVKVNSAE